MRAPNQLALETTELTSIQDDFGAMFLAGLARGDFRVVEVCAVLVIVRVADVALDGCH